MPVCFSIKVFVFQENDPRSLIGISQKGSPERCFPAFLPENDKEDGRKRNKGRKWGKKRKETAKKTKKRKESAKQKRKETERISKIKERNGKKQQKKLKNKGENKRDGGQRRKIDPKNLGPAFSLCCRVGIDAALVKAQYSFREWTPIKNKIEQIIQILRWRLAKVAFDTVRNFS